MALPGGDPVTRWDNIRGETIWPGAPNVGAEINPEDIPYDLFLPGFPDAATRILGRPVYWGIRIHRNVTLTEIRYYCATADQNTGLDISLVGPGMATELVGSRVQPSLAQQGSVDGVLVTGNWDLDAGASIALRVWGLPSTGTIGAGLYASAKGHLR